MLPRWGATQPHRAGDRHHFHCPFPSIQAWQTGDSVRCLRKYSETLLHLRVQLFPQALGASAPSKTHPRSTHPRSEWYGPGAGRTPGAGARSTRAGGGRSEEEERLEWPGIGCSRLLEPRACVFCLPRSGGGAGDGCAPRADQSGASRCRPVRQRLVGAQLLSGTKAEGGKKRRGWGGKKREKESANGRYWQARRALGAQAARRQARLPLRLGPPGRVKRGGGPRLAAGEGSGPTGALAVTRWDARSSGP